MRGNRSSMEPMKIRPVAASHAACPLSITQFRFVLFTSLNDPKLSTQGRSERPFHSPPSDGTPVQTCENFSQFDSCTESTYSISSG